LETNRNSDGKIIEEHAVCGGEKRKLRASEGVCPRAAQKNNFSSLRPKPKYFL